MFTIPTLERPKWTVQRQTAIVLRDCSASMYGLKAQEAEAACQELLHSLAIPKNKGAFDVAIVDFSTEATIAAAPTDATTLQLPSMRIRSFTDITKALLAAEQISAALPTDQARPVCVLLSDGAHNGSEDPVCVADRMKARIDIVTVAFGSDADESSLTRIASSAQHFYRCRNGQELRMFFSEIGTTLSVAINTNANVSAALGQMHAE
jgi:uncharacterized protein YegL